jgi:squalene-hopene/tetraprenyl-beta-curcumene cyclase
MQSSTERTPDFEVTRDRRGLSLARRSTERLAAVDAAIARAQEFFFARQHPSGYWHAPLEANVTMGAEYVFFNRFLGREKPEQEQRLLAYVRLLQREDGSWPLFEAGPGHLSATVEAYAANKMAGAK